MNPYLPSELCVVLGPECGGGKQTGGISVFSGGAGTVMVTSSQARVVGAVVSEGRP